HPYPGRDRPTLLPGASPSSGPCPWAGRCCRRRSPGWRSSRLLSAARALGAWRTREGERANQTTVALERDVPVLPLRLLDSLGLQGAQGPDQLRAGLVRLDHVVDVAALRRRVRVGEVRLVVLDQLLA